MAARSSNRSVSPAKYTVCDPAMTKPSSPDAPERAAASVVLSVNRSHRERADRHLLALLQRRDMGEALPAQKAAETLRAHDGQLLAEPFERGQVEVIPVGVRQQHGVEAAQRRGRDRAHAAQVEHARTEHRIGDQPNAVQVDHDGRVPYVGHVRHTSKRTAAIGRVARDVRGRRYGEQMAWHPERPTFHPVRLVVSWLVSAAALLIAAAIVPGVSVEGFGGALVAALLIAILNALLPPIVAGLRLPFMALLGFVLVLVLDALMLQLAAEIRPEAISVDDFGWALLAALVAAAASVVLDGRLRDERRRHVHAAGRPANREAPGRSDTDGHAGHRLPRDRRPGAAGSAPGDARRQRAEHGRWVAEGKDTS